EARLEVAGEDRPARCSAQIATPGGNGAPRRFAGNPLRRWLIRREDDRAKSPPQAEKPAPQSGRGFPTLMTRGRNPVPRKPSPREGRECLLRREDGRAKSPPQAEKPAPQGGREFPT